MAESNKSKIKGDNNKVIQGLTAGRDITIVINDNLTSAVKAEKEKIGGKIEELVVQLRDIIENYSSQDDNPDGNDAEDNPDYDSIIWHRLVQAIAEKGCVLFIGPEISIDEVGNSLHEKYYKERIKIDEFKDIEYLENEGFFTPNPANGLLYDIKNFYKKEFRKQNKSGRRILEKIAQIPFKLIISLCPDDTLHHVFHDFELKHKQLIYKKSENDFTEPDDDTTIIYNILGSAEVNKNYIFTHKGLYDYLDDIEIPSEIKKIIEDATYFLYIGFDFSKWYNRLLLFVLNFEEKQSNSSQFSIEKKTIEEKFEKFIEKQFNITSVHDDHDKFVNLLIQNAKEEEGIIKDLSKNFTDNVIEDLMELSRKVSDEEKEDPLHKLSKSTDSIGSKIESFKQLISS